MGVAASLLAADAIYRWGSPEAQTWIEQNLALPPGWAAFSEPWRWVTYAWVHALDFPLHVTLCLFALLGLGPAFEELFGAGRLLVILLAGVVGAGLAHVATTAVPGPAAIGFSGGIFGLLAGAAVLMPRGVASIPFTPLRLPLAWAVGLLVGWEAVCFAFDWMPGIAHAGHLGGAADGALVAWIMRKWCC